jgi:hypothetical protein
LEATVVAAIDWVGGGAAATDVRKVG